MQATANDINSGAYAKPKPPSQDGGNKRSVKAPKPSQDEIPMVQSLETSAKVLYDTHRDRAHAITKTIEFQAFSDEFNAAINRTQDLSPSFFEGLSNSYSPIALNHVPTLLLIASGVDDA